MASKAKKAVTATIKLVINAGQAKPAPPVGPALGQAGLNIMSFCKDFNAKTADKKVCSSQLPMLFIPEAHARTTVTPLCMMQPDIPVPVVITAYSDKSFTYVRPLPPLRCYACSIPWYTACTKAVRPPAKCMCSIPVASEICLLHGIIHRSCVFLCMCHDYTRHHY